MKYTYFFTEKNDLSKKELGGKGYNLSIISKLGLPVPQGFIITIDAYKEFIKKKVLPEEIKEEIWQAVSMLERKKVSIRSGAEIFMPGMMDTILNYEIKNKEDFFKNIYEVFSSFDNERAVNFRNYFKLDIEGTAVIIQQMVYGDKNKKSGVGVFYTRNPSTGDKEICGEFLAQEQGDALMLGKKIPEDISVLKKREIFKHFYSIADTLEKTFLDMQEVEFTIEGDLLYILQTQNGHRNDNAAVKIAVDLVNEGLIDKTTAISRLNIERIKNLEYTDIDRENSELTLITKASKVINGAVSGQLVFYVDEAQELSKTQNVILCREETNPEDFGGMIVSKGVLTTTGGVTSHAAIIARAENIPTVVGAYDLKLKDDCFTINGKTYKKGDYVTLNSTTGEVFSGVAKFVKTYGDSIELNTLLSWL